MDVHLQIDTITPFAEVCPEEYPPSHAKLHDRRDHEVHYYNVTYGNFVEKLNYFMDKNFEFPDIMRYKNYRYAVWSPDLSVEAKEAEASAWNGTDKKTYVEGHGFVFPRKHPEEKVITLEGNYAAFNSWFPGNFGHFAHDWLPSIALMRHILPDDTKFLLLDNKMSRKFIKFIDPDFYYERVLWVPYDQVYEIKGSLTVDIPLGVPDPLLGCCSGWDPMRQWIAEKQPKRVPADEKYVVFYSRKGNKDTKHGRVVEPGHENQILTNITLKLQQHKKPEKIIIFTGQDENGKTLSIEEQFEIFRGAHTFIGPHGSGLGGNYLWMDPFASKCEERTQLLEFMPGPETPEVHALYASYYGNIRKWPMDYHSLLYTDKSTYDVTKIHLQYLDDALDAMWGTPETLNLTIPVPVEEEEAKKEEDSTTKEAHAADEEEKKSEEQSTEVNPQEEEQTAGEPEEKTDNEEATKERIDNVIESATESLLEVSATSRRLRRSI